MNGTVSMEVSVKVSDPKCPDPGELIQAMSEAMLKVQQLYPEGVVEFSCFTFVNKRTKLGILGSTPVSQIE